MWSVVILGAIGVGAYLLLRDNAASTKTPNANVPPPPEPPPGVVQMSAEEYSLQSGGRPVYIVSYDVQSGVPINDSWVFDNEARADQAYAMLYAFFSDPAIRTAYTWPTGEIRVMKYGTPPTQQRFALIDSGGVVPGVQSFAPDRRT